MLWRGPLSLEVKSPDSGPSPAGSFRPGCTLHTALLGFTTAPRLPTSLPVVLAGCCWELRTSILSSWELPKGARITIREPRALWPGTAGRNGEDTRLEYRKSRRVWCFEFPQTWKLGYNWGYFLKRILACACIIRAPLVRAIRSTGRAISPLRFARRIAITGKGPLEGSMHHLKHTSSWSDQSAHKPGSSTGAGSSSWWHVALFAQLLRGTWCLIAPNEGLGSQLKLLW